MGKHYTKYFPKSTLPNSSHLAYEAWVWCNNHNIDYQSPIFQSEPGTHQWQQWAINFQEHCAHQNWIDLAQWMQIFIDSDLSQCLLPQKIGL